MQVGREDSLPMKCPACFTPFLADVLFIRVNNVAKVSGLEWRTSRDIFHAREKQQSERDSLSADGFRRAKREALARAPSRRWPIGHSVNVTIQEGSSRPKPISLELPATNEHMDPARAHSKPFCGLGDRDPVSDRCRQSHGGTRDDDSRPPSAYRCLHPQWPRVSGAEVEDRGFQPTAGRMFMDE